MAGERLDNEERDWSEDGKKVKQKERQKRRARVYIKRYSSTTSDQGNAG